MTYLILSYWYFIYKWPRAWEERLTMRTEQIQLVMAIAREKSISKAAQSLFISQPTASNMLKALERELGYPLFERENNGMNPTDKGFMFIDYASSIEKSLQAISQISEPIRHVIFKVLSMGFPFSECAFEMLCETYLCDHYAVDLAYQIIASAEDAYRMIEVGNGDVAIIVCKKSLYEVNRQNASRKGLAMTALDEYHLDLTCNKAHPLIRDGVIAYDLFGEYPCFSSIHKSGSELYAPYFLSNYSLNIRNNIVMNPSEVRYRLLQKTNGYLISKPISEELKAAYGFDSLPIENSDICVFALYRKDQQREALISDYIRNCRLLRRRMNSAAEI